MTRRQAIAILGSVLVLGAGAALIYAWSAKHVPSDEYMQYVNEEYGISFQYPQRYTLAEIERGDQLQSRHEIILTQHAGMEPGAPSISLDVFEHQPGSKTLEEWASSTQASHYSVRRGDVSEREVAGISGIRYEWYDGYSGESIILPLRGNVVMISVSYESNEDAVYADFVSLMASIQLAREGETLPQAAPKLPESYACTMEARLCPDGSYVGRTGPTCEFSACPNEEESASVQTGLGRSGTGLGIQLVPLEVVEDSRCPSGVVCIQAGTVRVRTQAGTEATSATVVFQLGQAQVIQGKTVTLTEVAPVQRTTGVISPSEYVFTFSISG